jgi:chemotaxis protein methyltransferase CheR
MEEIVYEKIKSHVKKLLNIDLNQYKNEQMQRRLDSWLIRVSAKSWDEYFVNLGKNPADLAKFRDYLTINVSEFFRDADRWEILRKTFLTTLLKEAAGNRISSSNNGLRIWSAGCSNGSEPYSLAIILDEIAPNRNHYILATDLDRSILAKARAGGPYSTDDSRNVTPEHRLKYFNSENSHFHIKENIGKRVTFKEQNMLTDPFENNFDLIVCRNVIIYFTIEAKAILYKKFHDGLRNGGILFLGGTEIIPRPSEIGLTNKGGSFYQKGNF